MKIKVEYSESVQVAEGLWRKIGFEAESAASISPDELEKESQLLHNQAKEYVQRWHKEANTNGQPIAQQATQPTEIQVDRPLSNTIEALIKDIQSCKDITTIDSYRILVKTKPELQEAFEKRRAELVSLESKAIIAMADAFKNKIGGTI